MFIRNTKEISFDKKIVDTFCNYEECFLGKIDSVKDYVIQMSSLDNKHHFSAFRFRPEGNSEYEGDDAIVKPGDLVEISNKWYDGAMGSNTKYKIIQGDDIDRKYFL
jgi:hypothetical protein